MRLRVTDQGGEIVDVATDPGLEQLARILCSRGLLTTLLPRPEDRFLTWWDDTVTWAGGVEGRFYVIPPPGWTSGCALRQAATWFSERGVLLQGTPKPGRVVISTHFRVPLAEFSATDFDTDRVLQHLRLV
jgi:hypothetical protein